MHKMNLHDNWRMKPVGEEAWYEAKVPGTMYADLIDGGVIEDPYWRDNEVRALPFSDKDYEYDTVFDADDGILDEPYVMLRFEGIDTLADIFLNGVHLGFADNMHRTWEYHVKDILKEKDNKLRVIFYSPTKYIAEEDAKDYWVTSEDAMAGASHLRKAHCMFGWDWGIRLPDCGIFRPVQLVGYDIERIDGVYIEQKHEDDSVYITPHIFVECFDIPWKLEFGENDVRLAERGLSCVVRVEDPEKRHVIEKEILSNTDHAGKEGVKSIQIPEPRLWWPNGLGEQPLYNVSVSLVKDGRVIDSFSKRIGLRTLTICRERDEYGEMFAHEVNGITYFAMGANYIPEDALIARRSPERTRELLSQAVAANHNTVRVWGGGFYPDDFFYDICDELGIVVWQDFMFACSIYMLNEKSFEENIKAEIIQNVKRIRNHASLGLWCGNNEMEGFFDNKTFGENDGSMRADYVKLFEYIIPEICRKYDPQTFYWPSSPSAGGGFTDTANARRGDVHNWDVWHANKPFAEYRRFNFRYLSEFGFQSFPSLRTVEKFTEPKDRNIFSYVMEKHQRNFAANGKIMNYMEATFLYPTDFDTLIYASQLLQAEAIRYGVEHFRRHRGECMGTIVWQLNDCWPVASWSSVDYYGRWKALHYIEKRVFAPLLLSCEEQGMLDQNPNTNAEPYELQKSVRLCISNESRHDENVTVLWELRDADAGIVEEHEETLLIPAQSSVWLDRVPMMHASPAENYVSFKLLKNGESVSEGTALFVTPKYFHFRDPELKVSCEGDEIIVKASAYARSVEIRNEDDDLILSDNFFDMNAGEKRVKIIKGSPEGLKVRSVADIK